LLDKISNLFSSLIQVFTLEVCLECQKESKSLICTSCIQKIKRTHNQPQEPISYGAYEGVLKNLIHLFKYENKFGLAKPLADLLIDLVPKDIDCIIPVPLHFEKLQERKYNQSALLAKELSQKLRLPLFLNVLKKKIKTPSQTDLSKTQREKNILGVFSVENENKIYAKNILLIDDVYTTGATVQECQKVLLSHRAQKVFVLTLAKS